MTSILSHFQSVVDAFIPTIVLLGLLIFVHELGHFLVAKFFKVRVEVFSLGFGPKLFQFKRGDTVYALSLIPFGGYVKMYGDDPSAVIDDAQKAVSFTHKPVSQRIAVVLAGPIMNFLFAILVFSIVALIGEQAIGPLVGDIAGETPAAQQGFRSGDTVKAADGKSVRTWDEFNKILQRNPNRQIEVVVAREGSAQEEKLTVEPKLTANKSPLSWDRQVGELDGLSAAARSSLIGVRDPQSFAGRAGLKTADYVKSVNGVAVTRWRELVAATAKSNGKLEIEAERGVLKEETADKPEIVKATIELPANSNAGDGAAILSAVGIENPELFLAGVGKESPAEKAGLKEGDRLVSIDGQAMNSFSQLAGVVRTYGERQTEGKPSEPLKLVIEREGKNQEVALAPLENKRMNQQGKEETRYEIGIQSLALDALPATVTLVSSNPIQAVQRGFQLTVHWTNMTILSFVRLFQNEVSPKNIGGFFSIGAMAKKSWQIGPAQFLIVMGIISINLFILNLLPVPVLDGGHLVFYTIEAIKGAPLSMRKMEIAQQVGLVLLLVLMVFALFNDVTRIIAG
ncbi:MAG: RIP metalloprotease RseP [Bdellovibrionota bacterium]